MEIKPQSTTNNVQDLVGKVVQETMRAKELALLQKMNFLIKQGVLIIEESRPVFTINKETEEVEVSVQVDLKVKEQQRIEELVEENEILKKRLAEGEQDG